MEPLVLTEGFLFRLNRNSIKALSTYILFFLFTISASAQDWHYTWNASTRLAYQNIEGLRLDKASTLLNLAKKEDPNNLIIPYLEDYVDFMTLFIEEDVKLFGQIKGQEKMRLDLLELGPKENSNYLLLQAEVMLHWALIEAKFENYSSAAIKVNKAFKLLKKNEAAFPRDMGTKRMISAIRAGVGTIPQKYLWIVKLLSSLEGSIEEGVSGLKEVYDYGKSNPSFIYKNEALFLYTIVATHFGNQANEMHSLLKKIPASFEKQPLLVFSKASVALEAGENSYVIQLLDQMKVGKDQMPFHYLSYLLGLTKLHRCDPDADYPLLHFVNHFDGQNYIKEAYQKLAWYELIHNNEQGYFNYMSFAKKEGSTVVDADKQAMQEAEQNKPPHKDLLRARLLSDGGYLIEAQKVISAIDTATLSFPELLEYHYRNGRIYQSRNEPTQAIVCFQKTILHGRNAGYYFACNSALQTGRIYENLGQPGQARHFYNECLSIPSNAYEASLHSKAKAGLNRLK